MDAAANEFLEQLRATLENHVLTASSQAKPPSANRLAQGWRIESMASAYEPLPPMLYLVDGLLSTPSLSIIYGGPGSLKSMLLADLAVCVAAGLPWLPALPEKSGNAAHLATVQSPVLWVDFDNGNRLTKERIGALGRGHGAPPDIPLSFVSMPLPWLDASDRTIIQEFAELVQEHKYKLICIDNLGLVSGDVEENKAEMAMVMGHFRWLCNEHDCAVVVIHHQRKGTGSAPSPTARKGDELRGHSSIEASLDLALLVERQGRENAVVVTPTKVRNYIDLDAIGALWTFEHIPGTRQLYSGKFFGRQVETGEQAVGSLIKSVISETLSRGKMTQKDLVDAVRDNLAARPGGSAPGINKVRGLLTQLVKEGLVIEMSVAGRKEFRIL